MDHSAAFRRCLETIDTAGIRALWQHVSPHLPQPANDAEALVAIHHARTRSAVMSLKARAYSHRWLTDHGYPSGLPDELKPKAERMYPRIVEGVGISVKAMSPLMRPIVGMVHDAMRDAVLDAYANGDTDPALVKARMLEARRKVTAQV